MPALVVAPIGKPILWLLLRMVKAIIGKTILPGELGSYFFHVADLQRLQKNQQISEFVG